MINGYIKKNNGVIEKITKTSFDYSKYSIKYDEYGELSNYISYLRIGFICGILGKYPKSILDVGYGNGAFLKCCRENINNCFGFDISDYPVPQNCHRVNSIFEDFFEVITFFDSLEHFEDISFVSKLKCNYVCISVPWCHNHSDDWFKSWKHLRPEEHFWHFDKDSLINFMNENGFDYISGLSLEDIIRKSNFNDNILTCMFKKR